VIDSNTNLEGYLSFILSTPLLFYPNSLAPSLGVSLLCLIPVNMATCLVNMRGTVKTQLTNL
jgi:hypothetical protein